MGMFGFTCSKCGSKDQFDYTEDAYVSIRVKDGFIRKKGRYSGYGYVEVPAYDKDFNKFNSITSEITKTKKDLSIKEDKWLKLQILSEEINNR